MLKTNVRIEGSGRGNPGRRNKPRNNGYDGLCEFLLLLCSIFAMPTLLSAQKPWDQPAFTADPLALYQAAADESVSDGSAILVLLDERRYYFDTLGRKKFTYKLVYRVLRESPPEAWSVIDATWEPWHQERPILRARVVTPDGKEYPLDPNTVAESGLETNQPGIFSDRKIVRAPLPAIGAGVVVEQEIVISETAPVFDQGTVSRVYFGRGYPVRQTRLIIDAPQQMPFNYKVQLLPSLESTRMEDDGRIRLTFELGPLEAVNPSEPMLPAEAALWPNVSFATGSSWQAVASRYNAVVDEQLRGADVASLVDRAALSGKTQREIAATLTARLHSEIRYTGVEYGEASLVPRSPAETLQRKYGDCKDKATLLIAMLREAGLSASLALLNTAGSEDAEPDLPGLGRFDHAIVYVRETGGSGSGFWIDATDPYSRIGELPPLDQGRKALIVDSNTSGLVQTPQSTSADNRTVETREFFLAELGPARVVEESQSWGSVEENYRSFFDGAPVAELQQYLEGYAAQTYLAESLENFELTDTTDFSAPYRIRLEMLRAQRGTTSSVDAAVAIIPGTLFTRLPKFLGEAIQTADESGGGKGASGVEPVTRKGDLELLEPYSIEFRYRIVPPPGFQHHPLPESREIQLGPALYSARFDAGEDGSIQAVLRFDTVERRFTAAETMALVNGAREVARAQPIVITFEQVGESHLAAGRVREALDEFRKLSALHPDEALHHSQLAEALLAAGIGESARAEAQRAVEMEPTSSIAYEALGKVLQYDRVGRLFHRGFDLEGTEAAYRKAIELDPSNTNARSGLAILLEHNVNGIRYGEGSKLEEAVKEYEAIEEKLGENTLSANRVIALMWAGRFGEMKDAAQRLSNRPQRLVLTLIATAATEGSEPAIRLAGREIPGVEERNQILLQAGETLVQLRMYAQAADLLGAGAQGSQNSAALLGRAAMLRGIRRHEDLPYPEDDPRTLIKKFFRAIYAPDVLTKEDLYPILSKVAADDLRNEDEDELGNQLRAVRNLLSSLGLPSKVLTDLLMALVEMSVEGNDETGYRIRTQSPGGAKPVNMTFFVVREEGQYRLLSSGFDLSALGAEVLARTEEGNLSGARRLLDWARESLQIVGGDDPLAGPPFPHLWTRGSQGGKDTIRYAAASLMARSAQVSNATSILREGRDLVASEEVRNYLELALTVSLLRQENYEEALISAQRLADAFPESETAFMMLTRLLVELERWDDCEKAIAQRLQRFPNDPSATRARMNLLEQQNRLPEAIAVGRGLIQSGRATPVDYNNLAWLALVNGGPTPEDVQVAERAALLTQNSEPGTLHTVAAVYAEVGRTKEARELLLRMMDLSGLEEPNGPAWFVFGRIAEQFGILDSAAAAYRKVVPPKGRQSPTSTYALAQRRLQAIEQH